MPSSNLGLKIGLIGVGLLIVLGLIVDSRRRAEAQIAKPTIESDLRTLLTQSDTNRWTDPHGLFSILRPAGWRVLTGASCRPYRVAFQSPMGPDLRVAAAPVNFTSMAALYSDLEGVHQQTSLNLPIEETNLFGRLVLKRTVRLAEIKVVTIDFVTNAVVHHLSFAAPLDRFDRYEPVLMDFVKTYRPLPPRPAPPPQRHP